MLKSKSLAFKLVVLMISITALIFLAVLGYNYYYIRRTMLKEVQTNARNLTTSTINRIETVLQRIEAVPRNIASLIEKYPYQREDYVRMLKDLVGGNRDLYGAMIAFAPYAFDPDQQFFGPYSYREGEQVKARILGGQDYFYFNMDWFQIPEHLGLAVWSEPYFDEGGGGITMSTFSIPFYREREGRKVFSGVVTADVDLHWLKAVVSAVKLYEGGYAFLVSQSGAFVTHPYLKLVMNESVFSIAEAIKSGEMRALGRRIISGQSGFSRLEEGILGDPVWVYFAPVPSAGWSLGVIVPEKELYADLYRLTWQLLGIGAVGFAVMAVAIALVSGRIVRPIRLLAGKTVEISRGNLDVELPDTVSGDEVGELTRSFGQMRTALKEYIANLAETTAAKERIESELKIARTIQMNFLPKRFPPFPERSEFEIFAAIEPAKEVGGDLYDFFLMGNDRLFFTIGDVSDKGVPAALFMAVTKTLLKGTAEGDMLPSDILARVNRELCQDNDALMFVTVFCGILNYRTGELAYSNAGHPPPLVLPAGREPEWLMLPHGLVLGAMENAAYQTYQTRLQRGDGLLLYTDGVTEAINCEQQFYEDWRLMECVRSSKLLDAQGLVSRVRAGVGEFSAGAFQADDITVLALKLK